MTLFQPSEAPAGEQKSVVTKITLILNVQQVTMATR